MGGAASRDDDDRRAVPESHRDVRAFSGFVDLREEATAAADDLRFVRPVAAAMDAMGLDAALSADPGSTGRADAECVGRILRANDGYETSRLVRETAERVAGLFAASCATHFLTVPMDNRRAMQRSFADGLRPLVAPDHGCLSQGRRFSWIWITWTWNGRGGTGTHDRPSLLLFDGVRRELQGWTPGVARVHDAKHPVGSCSELNDIRIPHRDGAIDEYSPSQLFESILDPVFPELDTEYVLPPLRSKRFQSDMPGGDWWSLCDYDGDPMDVEARRKWQNFARIMRSQVEYTLTLLFYCLAQILAVTDLGSLSESFNHHLHRNIVVHNGHCRTLGAMVVWVRALAPARARAHTRAYPRPRGTEGAVAAQRAPAARAHARSRGRRTAAVLRVRGPSQRARMWTVWLLGGRTSQDGATIRRGRAPGTRSPYSLCDQHVRRLLNVGPEAPRWNPRTQLHEQLGRDQKRSRLG